MYRARGRRPDRPQLRGRRADEVALRYLGNALDGGRWHSREGLSIFAWAMGIPRASFERVLARFELETERRGFLDECFVRLVPVFDRAALSENERSVLAELEALAGEGRP